MKPKLSQEAIELYDDECVDAGGVVPISAWDVVFVFMNAINKKIDNNVEFDLTKMEELFLLFINGVYARIFMFDPCDPDLLKLIVKDMSEMGYFGSYESSDSRVFWLNDLGTEFADEIFDRIPNEVKEFTNKIVETKLKYIEIRPMKTEKMNFTNSMLIYNESISDISLKLSSLLSTSIVKSAYPFSTTN